jgi:Na+/glutamate symporter
LRGAYGHTQSFEENNEIVGFTYAVFGLIYGVLLGSTIAVAWERY